jgi:RNA polymerase sigma factor (sigma-70 family)
MVERHRGLAGAHLRRLKVESRVSWDDLEAAALEAIGRAVLRWDPARGVRFSTYCWWAISNSLSHELNIDRRQTEGVATRSDWDLYEGPGTGLADRQEEVLAELEPLLGRLSEQSQQVVRLTFGLDGEPVSEREIARRMGIKPSAVRARLGMAMRIMRVDLVARPAA